MLKSVNLILNWFPVLLYESFCAVTCNINCFCCRPSHLILTEDERKIIGRKSKAIFNYGRQMYLESHGYKCRQIEYVTEETSPENVCILAKKMTLD
jgi:hypothetical protein